MTTALAQVQPFVYTNPQGLKLEVLFVLDLDKKGYINATAIAKQFEREPIHWLRNGSVQDYINSLLKQMNSRPANSQFGTKTITYDDIVITIQGGQPGKNGTWLHPKLAVVFARWLSPDFAVWCDDRISELLRQIPEQQRHFPELSVMFDKLAEQQRQVKQEIAQSRYEAAQFQRASQQRLHEIAQRLDATTQRFDARLGTTEQRFDDRLNTTEQVLNRFHEQLVQDNKNAMGGIYINLSSIHKILRQQQQPDLLQQPIQETVKQTLLDYQQVLEQMLRGQQDELIQGYLVKIQENLERIAQRFPEPIAASPVPNPAPIPEPLPPVSTGLVAEITARRAAGESWNHIAQGLNTRSTATPSGKGKWYGSSVKRYVESQR